MSNALAIESTEVPLRIEKLVYGGDGLARSDGRVVLTPYVLPGESVRAKVQRAKNDLLRGSLTGIVEPSPARIEAPCPYFQRCGGCHYQHTSYENQIEQKRLILLEVLKRVGRIEFEGEVRLVTGEPWHYRNRSQLHIHNGAAGYFASGSHEVVPIDHCPISSPKLNEAITALARDLPHYRYFDATVELFTNETELQINVLDRVPASVRDLLDEMGTREPIEYGGFRVSRNSFFQVNRFLVDSLVEAATGDSEGNAALDLYAGVGLFSAALAKRFGRVTAIESGGSGFRDLEWNMRRSASNVEPLKKTAEEFLAGLALVPDLIVADPPRTGLGKEVTRELIRLEAPRLTVVSCDPATLARDLRALLDAGYRIDRLTLIDLFPQTFHLETVAALRR